MTDDEMREMFVYEFNSQLEKAKKMTIDDLLTAIETLDMAVDVARLRRDAAIRVHIQRLRSKE